MSLPPRSAFRRLLVLGISGGLVLLLGGLGLVAGWQASERAMDTHVADRLALQQTLSGLVEQYVTTAAGDLDREAGTEPWDPRSARERLREVVRASRVDSGAVLVNANDRVLASWTPPGVALPPQDDAGWAALRDGVLARRLPVSGVLSPGVAPVTAVAVPVALVDGTRGTVVGLSAARVTNLQAYVAGMTYGRTGAGWVVDGGGRAVAAPEAAAVSTTPSSALLRRVLGGPGAGTAVYDDVDGVRRIVSWSRAGTTGWTALTVQDEEEFAGPLRRAGLRAQALVAALLVIAGTGLVVLHRKREAALERIAVRDDLTGLYNRCGWFSLADAELRRAARQGRERVLLFIDLDGLKQVNDLLGHREGDRAIASAAQVLSRAAREGDLVGRLGGDEFVLLLGDDGEAEAARARVLDALEVHDATSTAPFELRLSLGAEVWFPDSGVSLDELVRRADACMYTHKSGRPERGVGVVRVPRPRPPVEVQVEAGPG